MSTQGKRLEGKVALIMGGASGIGRGVTTWFAREGAKMVVVDISADGLNQVRDELGDTCLTVSANVTVEAEVERSVAAAVSHFEQLNIAVNCAGGGTYAFITDHSEQEWDRIINLNLKGVFLSMKHEGRQMITQETGGSIINIASLNSRQPAEGMSAYCSAKAGVEMITKVGAMEMGPRKVRVNAISPGLTKTPQTSPGFDVPAVYGGYLENIPLGRSGTTDDIAAAALFLASDEASWVSGHNLFVDGGSLTKRYPELFKLWQAIS